MIKLCISFLLSCYNIMSAIVPLKMYRYVFQHSYLCLRVENRTHEIPFFGLHHVHRCVSTRGSCPSSLSRYIPHTCSHLESVRVQSADWTASVHTLHMPKPNVTRVQSATERTASVHTLHMPKPNVTRVQSATEWTASVHTCCDLMGASNASTCIQARLMLRGTS